MEFETIAKRLNLSITEVRMAYYTGMRKLRREMAKRDIRYYDYFHYFQETIHRCSARDLSGERSVRE